jgi:g-D-glutamyl-meso-diaminopimelate peptidase
VKRCQIDHQILKKEIADMADKDITCTTLSRSIMGREIPLITLGRGKRAVLYVGTHSGTESMTARLLLDFIKEYWRQYERCATVYEYPMRYLFEDRRIYIVPMLNPDGVQYVLHGLDEANPLRDRVLKMNGGEDLSLWRANARGVDLGHNYDAGFASCRHMGHTEKAINGAPTGYCGEHPESEPETAALCRFLRAHREEIVGVLSFHMGKGEIFCSCGDNLTAKTTSVGRVLSRFTGYRLDRPENLFPQGTLADWCIGALHRPAFTINCGGVPNTSPSTVYEHLRRMLFSFPCVV